MRLRGPTMAIAWEQWRLVREAYFKAMSGSATILVVLRVTVFLDSHLPWAGPVDRTELIKIHSWAALLWAGYPLLRFVLSLVYPAEESDDRNPCLTTRQWLLPMRRGGFVAIYLLVRLGLLLSLAVLFGEAYSLLGFTQRGANSLILHSLVMSFGPALLFGFLIDWLLIRASTSRWVRMSLVVSLSFLLVATVSIGMLYTPPSNAGRYAIGSLATSAFLVMLTIGVALSFDRLAWLSRLPFSFDSLERLFRRRRRFRDGFMAHAWYEWRRHGLLGPGCYMAILTAVLFPIVCWSSTETEHPTISPVLVGSSPNVASALAMLLLSVWSLAGYLFLFDKGEACRHTQALYPRLMPGVPGMLTPISMVIAAHMTVLPTLALSACVLVGIVSGWIDVEMLPVTLGSHTTLAWALSFLATSFGLLALVAALLVTGWLVCMLIPCLVFTLIGWAAIYVLLADGPYVYELPVAGRLLTLWTNIWVALPACALLLFAAVGLPSLAFARKPLSRDVLSATTVLSCVLLAYGLFCELALLFNGLPPEQRLIPTCIAVLALLVLAALAIATRPRRFPHPAVGLLLALLIGGAMILVRLNYPGPLRDLSIETVCGLPFLCCLPMPAVLFHVRWVGTHWYDEPKEA